MNGGDNRRTKRQILLLAAPVACKRLFEIINQQPDLQVCAHCESAREALACVQNAAPDLVITDINLPGANGIELIKSLLSVRANLRILALSLYDERLYADRAIRAGAAGYIMNQAPVAEVVGAIRQILTGKRYVSPRMQEHLIEVMSSSRDSVTTDPMDLLSDREIEIFGMLGAGLSTQDISRRLSIGVKTVETHRANLKKKLSARNSGEVMRLAVEFVNRQSEYPPAA